MDVRIELCTSAKVYKKDNTRRVILFSVLIALYAIVIPYCYFTAGEPRKAAMIHAQKLADEKWALESSSLDLNSTVVETNEFIEVIPDSAESTADTNEEDEAVVNFGESGSKSSGIGSWFGPTKEQIRAKKEFEKWQREFKEKSGESATLPPEYLPSAWACLALFATLTAHALFHLLCHWIVAFKAMALFQPAKKVEEGCFILITPPPNRGHGAMVEVKKSATAGTLQVDFQRQKYIYTPASKLGDNAKLYPNGVLTLTAYPVNLPLSQYASAAGLRTDSEVERTLEVFGKNHLAVAIPSFLELLQLQLLSPLAIFQVFCALLWLLDEYWSYTVFTLVSVVVYEATTVFQRTRTQQMLGGMSPKPTPIFVYRCSRWVMTTTKDLLPGDVISLAYKKRAMNKGPAAPAAAAPASTPTAAPTPTAPGTVPGTPVAAAAAATASPAKMVTTFDEIVPCDCLLLRGSAVVNEASLTGESVPQMKEAIVFDSTSSTNNEEKLDMSGANRVNTLFSGSSLVTVDVRNVSTRNKTESTTDLMAVAASTHETSSAFAHIPPPPDGGALAYVLRTGFGSSQGNLLQMIEFSQQTVTGDSRETGMALLMLFVFALMASGYVLKEGLRKKEKTTHEILLKCVIIITSVVPRQFPMQMAMAVNMALMSLSKAGIFCTEPYRVPLAGKVSHCLFDKTGTLTTDQLVPVGIINHSSSATAAGGGDESDDSNLPALSPVGAANAETAMILAACHSLVVVDDGSAAANGDDAAAAASNPAVAPFDPKNPVFVPPTANLVGDPIEVAAIKGIDWSWDAPTSTATPDGAVKRQTIALAISRRNLAQLNSLPAEAPRPPNYLKNKEILETEIKSLESKLVAARQKASTALYNSIQVIQRHHFSSALQRMSVVCRCNHQHTGTGMESKSSSSSDHWYCLVKGSPEALKQLIVPSAVPSWYTACYESMARKGLRVLALAYKRVYAADSPADKSRQWVEKDLYFGGFIAFECKIRADSGVVVKSLIKADHKVAMLTGDALLTSLHVAKQVGICDTAKDCLTLHKPKTEGGSAYWVRRTEATGVETEIPFDATTIPKIGKEFNLLTIEETFLAVAELTGGKSSGLWKHAGFIKVFARMSPQGKASIIQSIQDSDKDHHVFMCGDGGNDVGALKQADIGLALLAGHANANTSEDILPPAVTNTDTALTTNTGLPQDPNMSPEDYLNLHDKKLKARADVVNKLRAEHMKEFQARYTKEQQALLQEQIRQKTEAGEYMAMFTLMKDQAARIKQAMADENARFMAMHGQVWDPKKDGDGLTQKTGVEKMMESLDTGDAGGLQMIRPGDASKSYFLVCKFFCV